MRAHGATRRLKTGLEKGAQEVLSQARQYFPPEKFGDISVSRGRQRRQERLHDGP
jgi:hypothetical protein